MQTFTKYLLLLLFLSFCNYKSQKTEQYTYAALTEIFDSYQENDERAMIFVNLFLEKAKNDKKLKKIISGYDEAVYYSRNVEKKISYADSAVVVALSTKDDDLISTAYLKKGIVYYYNKRNYRQALQQYILAYEKSKNTKDFYLLNKILYHLGMVKSYLGFYEEAATHFRESANYYEEHISDKEHPNITTNNLHGYLNSIFRLSGCFRNLHQYKSEDSLIDIGLTKVKNTNEFALEFAYFQKAQGIQNLRKGSIVLAESRLKLAEDILKQKQDFVALATTEFYLGKLESKKGNQNGAINYHIKVDSLMNIYKFVTPEIIANYEFLIKNSKDKGNDSLQLYYTNQLLKADSIIKIDFAFLWKKLNKDYDVKSLNDSRETLIRKQKCGTSLFTFIFISGILVFYYFISRFRKKQRDLNTKYRALLVKIAKWEEADTIPLPINHVKSIYSEEMVEEIKYNLKVFEEKKQFLDKDLKLPDVALLTNTHRTALSFVLNEHLRISFSQYLKELRIKYITKKIMEDSKYLKYSMETLADECGMKNRQVFSNHFLEINGIRPTDFVKKRQEEVSNNQ